MKCPYCDRVVDRHPSGLGYSCTTHGFIPNMVMADGPRNEWRPLETENKVNYANITVWDTITLGEAGARETINIPADATDEEAKRLIDKKLTWLWYAKDTHARLGLVPEKRPKKDSKDGDGK